MHHRDLSNSMICGDLPQFSNTTIVNTEGTKINNSCSAASPVLTNEELVVLRKAMGQFLYKAHVIVQDLKGEPASQEEDTTVKVIVTLAAGLGSFALFFMLGWVTYCKSTSPKLINADLSRETSS